MITQSLTANSKESDNEFEELLRFFLGTFLTELCFLVEGESAFLVFVKPWGLLAL